MAQDSIFMSSLCNKDEEPGAGRWLGAFRPSLTSLSEFDLWNPRGGRKEPATTVTFPYPQVHCGTRKPTHRETHITINKTTECSLFKRLRSASQELHDPKATSPPLKKIISPASAPGTDMSLQHLVQKTLD